QTNPGLDPGATRAVAVAHPYLGDLELLAGAAPDGTAPTWLFCDNETNDARLYGTAGPAYPNDGINEHERRGVSEGAAQQPRAPRRADGQPGRVRHEDRGLVPAADRRRRDGRDPPPLAPRRRPGQGLGRTRPHTSTSAR